MGAVDPSHTGLRSPWIWLAALVVFVVIVQNAWVCDDAFITARVARNVAEGRGAVFNPGWRVQVYTHPLWMLMMVPGFALGMHPWWLLLGLGLGCSLAALWILVRRFALGSAWPLAFLALAASQAAIDYSSSGLENPSFHLIALGFASAMLAPDSPTRLRVATRWLALAFCCRPDAPLLLLPGWLALVWTDDAPPRIRVRELLIGSAPAWLWLAFALTYHGSALPNTALAKLATGLPLSERVLAGWHYLARSALEDPAGVALLIVGTVVGLRHRDTRCLSLGIPLSALYVLWIGGDFMMGRFLSAPMWLAAAILARSEWPRARVVAVALLLAVIAAWSPRTAFKTSAADGLAPGERAEHEGIADERRYYARHSSVFALFEHGYDLPQHPWREAGESLANDPATVHAYNTVGFYAWFAPRDAHVVDAFALCDPLLARLPPLRRIDWRPGHFARAIPEGYLRWLEQPATSPTDAGIAPELHPLLEDLRLAHYAPLLSPGRLGAILRLATHQHALDPESWRLREREHVSLASLARTHRKHRFRDAGLWLDTAGVSGATSLEFSASLRLEIRALDADARPLRTWGEDEPLVGRVTLELPAQSSTLELWPVQMGGRRSATVCVAPCRPD